MIKYYDSETKTFDCQKAYKYYVKKIGTDRPSKMTDEQIVVFELLCHLKRNANTISIDEVNSMKDYFLSSNYKFPVEIDLSKI